MLLVFTTLLCSGTRKDMKRLRPTNPTKPLWSEFWDNSRSSLSGSRQQLSDAKSWHFPAEHPRHKTSQICTTCEIIRVSFEPKNANHNGNHHRMKLAATQSDIYICIYICMYNKCRQQTPFAGRQLGRNAQTLLVGAQGIQQLEVASSKHKHV
jgi:hypothetical protein